MTGVQTCALPISDGKETDETGLDYLDLDIDGDPNEPEEDYNAAVDAIQSSGGEG